MPLDLGNKSTIEQIRVRFDKDVERFSNLDTGQEATIDAPVMLRLTADAALSVVPHATRMLDIGCGAGNFTLKILKSRPDMHCDLVDLSLPMLNRARKRVIGETTGRVQTFQGDIRDVMLDSAAYDIVVAAAVLHHLREDDDWHNVFRKLYDVCADGGCLWIVDLIRHDTPEIQHIMERDYSDYLDRIGGPRYRDAVMATIDQEDSPRTLSFQLELLQKVGFARTEILHKNGCYAAFGALKAP